MIDSRRRYFSLYNTRLTNRCVRQSRPGALMIAEYLLPSWRARRFWRPFAQRRAVAKAPNEADEAAATGATRGAASRRLVEFRARAPISSGRSRVRADPARAPALLEPPSRAGDVAQERGLFPANWPDYAGSHGRGELAFGANLRVMNWDERAVTFASKFMQKFSRQKYCSLDSIN